MSLAAPQREPLLAIVDVEVAYERIITALRGVSLVVPRGSIVALLGPNGAGKSTTLKAAAGLLPAERGEITAGQVRYDGQDITAQSPRDRVRAGVVQVLEGRHCFAHLTVEENLRTAGAARALSRSALHQALDRVYAHFPRLTAKRKTYAGYTSGGEQQMLAIGRALITQPRLLLLDEPSMGLAPKLVEEIFAILSALNAREGVTLLLAEQNANLALRYAHHGYVLENGRVVASGEANELRARPEIREFYLGIGAQGRLRFGRTMERTATMPPR